MRSRREDEAVVDAGVDEEYADHEDGRVDEEERHNAEASLSIPVGSTLSSIVSGKCEGFIEYMCITKIIDWFVHIGINRLYRR